MVLIRMLVVLLAVLGGACGESLFDNNGPGDGGANTDGEVPTLCPAPCLGDAAADYDPSGTRWRYLEDQRNRTWTAMTPAGGGVVGADPANTITTCAAEPASPACAALPGALLVSTAGSTSVADPAIAFTSATAQVIQLSVRVHVPAEATEQRVRIYRNSREDALFTGMAVPGTTFEHALTVDALADDRFFLALAPAAGGAAQIGAHFYVNGTGATFPSKCQLAVGFGSATGNLVDDACGPDVTHHDYLVGTPVPPVLGPGPYPELGMAADLTAEKYYDSSSVLDKAGDTTIQMWVRHDAVVDVYGAWVFSDLDLDAAGDRHRDLRSGRAADGGPVRALPPDPR